MGWWIERKQKTKNKKQKTTEQIKEKKRTQQNKNKTQTFGSSSVVPFVVSKKLTLSQPNLLPNTARFALKVSKRGERLIDRQKRRRRRRTRKGRRGREKEVRST
jgi:hypothetical protein